MITIIVLAFVLSTLLHGKALAFSSSLNRNSERCRSVLFATLDREFVTNVYNQCSPSVALVLPRGVRNITTQGSGFVIAVNNDERYILTSAHVAAGGMTVEVALPSDNYAVRYNASVIGRAPNGEDIALLVLCT
jgi:S1-C subfamily serine protease